MGSNDPQRLRLKIRGVVQGVGFRPFLYGVAGRFGLTGYVANTSEGVVVEVQGPQEELRRFQSVVVDEPPVLAQIKRIEVSQVERVAESRFRIVESEVDRGSTTFVSPDVATCEDCLSEIFNVEDRRFRYPFTNCTNCGPRFTITRDVPYDRHATTMQGFTMCKDCLGEYEDPANRRFHAQPNACDVCGPQLRFAAKNVENDSQGEEAILEAQRLMADGGIIAVKGIGGFHLACDARSDSAIAALRGRKGRIEKPFAVMCRDVETAERLVGMSGAERRLLTSHERPIVLLRKLYPPGVPELIAPGNELLGIMLPYSPLHHLLLNSVDEELKRLDVLVMTSGNRSDEPIVIDNNEALDRLSDLADAFLVHDREILAPCDDSVLRIVEQRELPIRRSRGYAPMPVQLPFDLPPILAVGGEIKNTLCLAKDDCAFMSQHIGDMENLETLRAFERSANHMSRLFRIEPEIIACDKHPMYLSSQWAKETGRLAFPKVVQVVEVQHHHAHIASVMAENGLDGSEKVIGFAFDGTGYGDDGAIWGGEVLLADYAGFERLAHLEYLPLPGGDASIKKPYRAALSYLWSAGVEWDERLKCVAACSDGERQILRTQIERKFNTVPTSSMGRLFDVVAAIAGVRQTITYEAQGAIELEALIDKRIVESYNFEFPQETDEFVSIAPFEIGVSGLISEVAGDVLCKVPIAEISAKFHNAVVELIIKISLYFRERDGLNKVALSGGCFQNVALLQNTTARLRTEGFEVFTHRLVPPNDGGLALGQAAIAGFKFTK